MPGIQPYGREATGLIRTYRPVVVNTEAPDNTIALFATVAGNVTVTTMAGDAVTLPIPAGGYRPIEPHTVTAWSGAGASLFYCIA